MTITKKTGKTLWWYLVMILLSLIFAFPLFWMFVGALKKPEELAANMTYTVFPREPQWQHFREVLFTDDVIPFWSTMRNTLVLAITVSTLTTLSSALAGFGFARYRARGKEFLFTLLLATLMLPWVVTFIPTFMLFNQLKLLGLNPWPLGYLPFWITALPGSALFIFYFRQYFATLPKDLEDAARVDGCSRFSTFWRIFMPSAGPVIATAFLLSFQWTYTSFIEPMLFLNNEHAVMGMRMANDVKVPGAMHINAHLRNGPYRLTVGIFYSLPIVLVFFACQRYFIQGIVTTGIKS
ncbi:MAG: carbohydrate ABC transporter permease [Firmicutes bacterium]|nr:carbohydrate ABC transporter permease [Bacillota bacterium]